MQLRRLKTEDHPFLLELLRALPEFTEGEVTCAMELVADCTTDPVGSGYWGIVAADDQDRPLGYAIYGPTPMTQGAFDLYWIASRTDLRGKGIGRSVLAEVERDVKAHGGFVIRIETSAKDAYGATRKFYEATRYRPVGQIPDFYKRGDALVILAKDLDALPAEEAETIPATVPAVESAPRPLRQ